jgi:hypothetical protein
MHVINFAIASQDISNFKYAKEGIRKTIFLKTSLLIRDSKKMFLLEQSYQVPGGNRRSQVLQGMSTNKAGCRKYRLIKEFEQFGQDIPNNNPD